MSNLTDWKEILAGAEDDYERAKEAVIGAKLTYNRARYYAQDVLQHLERLRKVVAALEAAESQTGASR